ncbi:MAG TPA: hypothetical protein VEY87_12935 [Gaiellaceae bacterium]|nr:hypothetical protein [Gaiellaceae bacterium]
MKIVETTMDAVTLLGDRAFMHHKTLVHPALHLDVECSAKS